MKIITNIDSQNRVRSHKVHGMLKIDELKDQLKQIYTSPEYDSDMNVIWDLREANFSQIKTSEVKYFMSCCIAA